MRGKSAEGNRAEPLPATGKAEKKGPSPETDDRSASEGEGGALT